MLGLWERGGGDDLLACCLVEGVVRHGGGWWRRHVEERKRIFGEERRCWDDLGEVPSATVALSPLLVTELSQTGRFSIPGRRRPGWPDRFSLPGLRRPPPPLPGPAASPSLAANPAVSAQCGEESCSRAAFFFTLQSPTAATLARGRSSNVGDHKRLQQEDRREQQR